MLIYSVDFSGTTASGVYSANTKKFNSVLLKQIIIEFTTDGTTFNLAITDRDGLTVFNTDTVATSKYRQEMEIPLKDICTVRISSASADEVFKGKILVQEIP